MPWPSGFSASDLRSDVGSNPDHSRGAYVLEQDTLPQLLLSTQEWMGTCEGRVGCCVWLALWFVRLMSRGNNEMRLEHHKLADTCAI